ncbi:hypothetical protein ACE1BS_14735 [Aeromonas jandaei]|uniref:hypothetical protein n=1 Tax=Aeromonas TaxID=642 RepID=UPI00051C84D5|nr:MULTISPECIES: hypothetical protein [Aeromonas]PTT48796.1 hypothetical protein DBR09_02165 [Aeromonas sp. HMWF016]
MKMLKIIISALTLLLVTGCSTSQPVMNMTNSLVPSNLSEQDVSRAIINAGVSKTWVMREERPGLITGHIQVRQHQANISIPYNTTNYSINYVSSVNLNDKGKGKIHRTYNRWINGLNQAIQLELNRASSNK